MSATKQIGYYPKAPLHLRVIGNLKHEVWDAGMLGNHAKPQRIDRLDVLATTSYCFSLSTSPSVAFVCSLPSKLLAEISIKTIFLSHNSPQLLTLIPGERITSRSGKKFLAHLDPADLYHDTGN